jgi:acyl carrier protein
MLEPQSVETAADSQTASQRVERRAAEIQAWLVTELARVVRVGPHEINPEQPFVRYGLGSIQGLELAAKMEDWIGFPLPPTLVWDYPNIEVLARHLAEDPEGVAAAADYQEDE